MIDLLILSLTELIVQQTLPFSENNSL